LLEKHGWILGGEGSGHLLVLDKQSTGDGLVNALQVLQACIRNGLQPADMLQGIELFPQTLINLKIPSGFNWQQSAELQKTRQEVEAMLKGQGRVLIRPSGTEPLLRIMVEAADAGLAHACAQKLVDSLQ
jgi:phosphoglucosamine mutase